MTDHLSPEKRSWNMSRVRGKNTKPEILLRSLLHKAGFRFRIHTKHIPGKPDIVLRKYRTVIFVNGCFWHRHEGCKYASMPRSRTDFWNDKFSKTIERDKRQYSELKNLNWNVVIVWECELKRNADAALKQVIENLESQLI